MDNGLNALPPTAAVMRILMGLVTSSAVSAVARLGIPDHLENGAMTAQELAAKVGADPELLFRLMRATSGLGVLAQASDGKWEQTPLSDVLRTSAPATLRDVAIMFADDWHMRTIGSLHETVRTGQLAVDRLFGMQVFKYFETNTESAENFNRAMTSFSTTEALAIVNAYDFSETRSLTEVAGGQGLFLASVLERHPGMTATLLELPQVVETIGNGQLKKFGSRVKVVEGDMFKSVPAGADTYMMKRIIHDWSDDQSVKILSACRASVPNNGRLLVVDSVVPTDMNFSPVKLMDLIMMLFSGGKERTEDEFRTLFARSGWHLNRIIPTASPLSIIEGLPAST
jgi:O-methyltransferase domain/Dimerisation domain